MRRSPALPLRVRVTLLYTLLGLLMSMLFAGMFTFIGEDYERVLVQEILRSQAEDYAARLQRKPATELPRSQRMHGYLRRKDGSGDVPEALAALPPGLHESTRAGEDGLHVGVFDAAPGRLYFSIDLSGTERLERHMRLILAAIIVLGTLVSAWLGWLLSGAVVRPVRRLADAVDGLSAQPTRTALAAQLPHDELGRLGKAIDDYQARLVLAEDTERAFFADASHELRTPLAVVRGATELLLEDGADMPQLQPRLQRLDRGMQQLSELLDALLGLARRRTAIRETIDLCNWLGQCLSAIDGIRDGMLRLSVHCHWPQACELPTREAELVLRGVIRQLVPAAGRGTLAVEAGDGAIRLRFIDDAAETVAGAVLSPQASDRRLGMTLIGRLANRIGWSVDDSDTSGRCVVILFNAAD